MAGRGLGERPINREALGAHLRLGWSPVTFETLADRQTARVRDARVRERRTPVQRQNPNTTR